ncbi:excinuclease ABC subunit B [Flavobacterium sp. XN-5]|uniref:excinuclease ABC subunit B n=1 Tax=Flavobacterium sp. XN-5 TaxID=2599390 RepID=UPI0011C75B7B|nr:excinuclease ABC subunit B [Flavobacterium sp. XN-5]NGY38220.1 excinuclease ABC subunit B [Flavobacterium sp. XN-5]
MNEEKRSLLKEMIAFSTVDGHLQKKEYELLFLVANELNIEKGGFNDLCHQKLPKLSQKKESERIQQFYRLAVLLNSEGNLYVREAAAIKQIGMSMGLNPDATKRVLRKMEKAPTITITEDVLVRIYKEEQN